MDWRSVKALPRFSLDSLYIIVNTALYLFQEILRMILGLSQLFRQAQYHPLWRIQHKPARTLSAKMIRIPMSMYGSRAGWRYRVTSTLVLVSVSMATCPGVGWAAPPDLD